MRWSDEQGEKSGEKGPQAPDPSSFRDKKRIWKHLLKQGPRKTERTPPIESRRDEEPKKMVGCATFAVTKNYKKVL